MWLVMENNIHFVNFLTPELMCVHILENTISTLLLPPTQNSYVCISWATLTLPIDHMFVSSWSQRAPLWHVIVKNKVTVLNVSKLFKQPYLWRHILSILVNHSFQLQYTRQPLFCHHVLLDHSDYLNLGTVPLMSSWTLVRYFFLFIGQGTNARSQIMK